MTVYVNGRFLTEEATGVQRFAEQLVLGLSDLRGDVVVLTPPGVRPLGAADVSTQVIGSGNPLKWEQWDLPVWLRRNGNPLLVNLGNRAPMLYRHQVSTLHDLLPMRFGQNFSLRFRLQFRLVAAVGVVRRSHRLLTVSDSAAEEIRAYYGLPRSRTSVVHNGVDHRAEPSPRDDEPTEAIFNAPYALAFGRAGAHRNAAITIAAMRRLLGSSSISLVLVGTPDPDLMRRAASLGARCVFTGRVSDGELDALYSGAACFVAPSRYEGFDIPPLEAQRAGTPVIASRLPVHHEVLADSALYFEPDDARELAETIVRVVEDPHLRRDLVDRGHENYRRFDWATSAASLNRVIDEVAS